MPHRGRLALTVLACLAAGAPVAAQQVADSQDPVGDTDVLLRSSYDATGVRVGSFIAYPAIDAGTAYTSNVHQSATDRTSDSGVIVAPELRLESDWSRHSAKLSATSSHVRYNRNPQEDVDEATVRADLRLDVTSRTTVEANGSFQLGQEERGSVEVPQGAVSSPEIITWSAGAGLSHRFNRLTASLRGRIDTVEYGATDLGGGLSEDNGDRDYLEAATILRLGYEVSPVLQPFVEGGYSVREHDESVDRNGFRRDSKGYAISGGVAVNLGPILRGEVSAGYVHREYSDATLDPAEGLIVSAGLTWAPTRLTTVVATASTAVSETTVAGASAALGRSVTLDVTHSLSYNVTAKAGASYSHTKYPGMALDEDSIGAQASLEYMLNPNVILNAGYAYRWYDSTQPNSQYDSHGVKLGVRLQE